MISEAASALSAAGVPTPRSDAELLAAHVLGVSRGRVALGEFTETQLTTYHALVAERARRVPLQHLTGTAPFRYLELEVGPGVFVPRPETELLVSWGLSVIRAANSGPPAGAAATAPGRGAASDAPSQSGRAGPRSSGPNQEVTGRSGDRSGSRRGVRRAEPEWSGEPTVKRPGSGGNGARATVVDLCAGSGAIALAVAQEAPGTTVYAVELAPEAYAWLRRNAARRAAAGDPPVTVVAGDVADPTVLAALDGQVDLVLSNPPYVPAGTPVEPEVAEYDPPTAVFGGPDGLAVVRAVVDRAARLLAPGGHVGIEHDETHADAVPALLAANGRFQDIRGHRDLAGRSRYTTARMADCTP